MHVVHSSPSSVLVVHRLEEGEREPRVLLAVDGSRGSEFATRSVAGFCDRSTKIEVVSVARPPTPFAEPGAVAVMQYPDRALLAHLVEKAHQDAEHAATALGRSGFEVETLIAEGSPLEQILKRAEGMPADLVAVGARGLGSFQRALLGSTSDHVVRHARAALVGRRRTDNTET
jgi:nucleotide-binding universal stress UspA family protein